MILRCFYHLSARTGSLGFTSFQSIFISVDFIWTEFIFKPSGRGWARAPRALHPPPESVDEFTAAERSTRQCQGYLKPVQY